MYQDCGSRTPLFSAKKYVPYDGPTAPPRISHRRLYDDTRTTACPWSKLFQVLAMSTSSSRLRPLLFGFFMYHACNRLDHSSLSSFLGFRFRIGLFVCNVMTFAILIRVMWCEVILPNFTTRRKAFLSPAIPFVFVICSSIVVIISKSTLRIKHTHLCHSSLVVDHISKCNVLSRGGFVAACDSLPYCHGIIINSSGHPRIEISYA